MENSCDICDKSFSLKSNLSRHKRSSHFKIKLKNKNCDKCAFKARDSYQLKLHLRTHSGEKPYQCDQCKFKFSREKDSTRHMKSCRGLRNYCLKCGKVFKNKFKYNDHYLWDSVCGKLPDFQAEELVRVKAYQDMDVVGLKSRCMLDQVLYVKSGRKVSCGVCIGCTKILCQECSSCIQTKDEDEERKCARNKCLHPVNYYTLKNQTHLTQSFKVKGPEKGSLLVHLHEDITPTPSTPSSATSVVVSPVNATPVVISPASATSVGVPNASVTNLVVSPENVTPEISFSPPIIVKPVSSLEINALTCEIGNDIIVMNENVVSQRIH